MENQANLLQWHKDYTSQIQEKLGLSVYQMMWFSWIKGVVFAFIAIVVAYSIWYFKYSDSGNIHKHGVCKICGNNSIDCQC